MKNEFDSKIFEEIKELMEDGLNDLIKKYKENAEKYIEGIEKGVALSDYKMIEDSAHPLKSSSALLGLIGISTIAGKIESLSTKNPRTAEEDAELRHLAILLPSACTRAQTFLDHTDNIAHQTSPAAVSASAKIKILHIDDDAVICKITQRFLSEEFEVKSFLSIEEMLSNLEEYQPNAILIDFMMPDMEGMFSLLNLKADPRLSSIPVIYVTGLDQTQVSEKLGLDVAGYVKKPYKPEELISKIHEVLENQENAHASE